MALLVAFVAAGCSPSVDPIDPARIAAVSDRVEAIRQLAFENEVAGRWVDRHEVRAILAAKFETAFSAEDALEGERLLRDLGFWHRSESLRSVLLDHDAVRLAGFYDPTPVRILYAVRDPSFDPSYLEGTLVHELAHALQDQHAPAFSLANGIDEEGDLLFAFAALQEGAAQWVQYQDTLNREGWPIPTAATAKAEAKVELVDSAMPSLISWGRVRVYSEGYAFVRRLLEAGGTAALNRALADPPLSSAEILHPERYLDHPRHIPFIAAEPGHWADGCEVLAGDVFGELGLAAWQADYGIADETLTAAWDGDRAWRLRCGSTEQSVWVIQFEHPDPAAAFLSLASAPKQDLPRRLLVEGRGRRVIFHSGLPEAALDALFETLKVSRLASFDDYLAANPAVSQRAAARIREASD